MRGMIEENKIPRRSHFQRSPRILFRAFSAPLRPPSSCPPSQIAHLGLTPVVTACRKGGVRRGREGGAVGK